MQIALTKSWTDRADNEESNHILEDKFQKSQF